MTMSSEAISASPLSWKSAVACLLLVLSSSTQLHVASALAFSSSPNGSNSHHQDSLIRASQKVGLLNQFDRDCQRLSELRPADPEADISAPKQIISDGSTYTKLWTEETWRKHGEPPHKRYARHVMKWGSSKTARKVLPTVFVSTVWAAMLSVIVRLYSRLLGTSVAPSLVTNGSSAAFSLLAAPLALLLTLRANSSLGRLFEARLLWGRLVLLTRSLACALRIHIFPTHPNAAILAARHLTILGWVLKAYVRYETFESEQQVIHTMLGKNSSDAEWLSMQNKRAVAIMSRLRHICAAAMADMSATTADNNNNNNAMTMTMTTTPSHYTSSIHYHMEDKIANLEAVVGGCQRLSTSPIPPTYSRHLSRVMVLWILFMPMSYVAAGLSTFGVAVAAAVSTYVLVGIDEGGMEIEQVFQLVPLHQLAVAVQNDVKNEFMPMGGEMPVVPL